MKIGLALGSGAARGWAHIGIIQALEEMGIQVDVVAGCSIGAYVGAAYSSGNLEGLAEWASGLTEWQVFTLLGVGIRRGSLASGQKVFQALEDNFTFATFEEMNKPLGVVATDLYSGNEVTFTSGPVIDAVRASCAIPALFPPVANQGRWLVDGAVVNPVPVNLCRQLGAEFVIAVNLGADYRPQTAEEHLQEHEHNEKKTADFFSKSQALFQQWFKGDDGKDQANEPQNDDEVTPPVDKGAEPLPSVVPMSSPSMVGVMSSSLEILQARVTRSRLAGEPPEILLEPQLGDFGIMEFHRTKELILEGHAAVDRMEKQIRYQLRIA